MANSVTSNNIRKRRREIQCTSPNQRYYNEKYKSYASSGHQQDTPYSDLLSKNNRFLELIEAGMLPHINLTPTVNLYGEVTGELTTLAERVSSHGLPDLVKQMISTRQSTQLFVGPSNSGQRFGFQVWTVWKEMNVLDMTNVHRLKFLRESVADLHTFLLATPSNTAILIEICSTDGVKFQQHWRNIIKLFTHNRRRHTNQQLIVICDYHFANTLDNGDISMLQFPGTPTHVAQMLALHVKSPEYPGFQSVISTHNQIMLIANRMKNYHKVDEVLAEQVVVNADPQLKAEGPMDADIQPEPVEEQQSFVNVMWTKVILPKDEDMESEFEHILADVSRYKQGSAMWRFQAFDIISRMLAARSGHSGARCNVGTTIHRTIPFGINEHVAIQALTTAITQAVQQDYQNDYNVDLFSEAKGTVPGALVVRQLFNVQVCNVTMNINQYGTDQEQHQTLMATTVELREALTKEELKNAALEEDRQKDKVSTRKERERTRKEIDELKLIVMQLVAESTIPEEKQQNVAEEEDDRIPVEVDHVECTQNTCRNFVYERFKNGKFKKQCVSCRAGSKENMHVTHGYSRYNVP
jgi:hypothetical protein